MWKWVRMSTSALAVFVLSWLFRGRARRGVKSHYSLRDIFGVNISIDSKWLKDILIVKGRRQKEEGSILATERISLPGSEVEMAEAYAIAHIQDYQPDQQFHLDEPHVLLVGIQSEKPEGFKGVPMVLPSHDSTIQFEVVVHADDMEVEPTWIQPYIFIRNAKPSLLTFSLTPTKPGLKQICVEFLYQRHWLTSIQFEVMVEKAQKSVMVYP